MLDRAPLAARYALAGIRILNGAATLARPAGAARRFGVEPGEEAAIVYVLRLFGARTVAMGVEIVVKRGAELDRALRVGALIHASDALAALAAGMKGQLPKRTAAMTTAISGLNIALSLAALRDGGVVGTTGRN